MSVQFPSRERHFAGSPDYYRDRATEMLRKSEEVETEEAKRVFLTLAESWDRMAQLLEHPNW